MATTPYLSGQKKILNALSPADTAYGQPGGPTPVPGEADPFAAFRQGASRYPIFDPGYVPDNFSSGIDMNTSDGGRPDPNSLHPGLASNLDFAQSLPTGWEGYWKDAPIQSGAALDNQPEPWGLDYSKYLNDNDYDLFRNTVGGNDYAWVQDAQGDILGKGPRILARPEDEQFGTAAALASLLVGGAAGGLWGSGAEAGAGAELLGEAGGYGFSSAEAGGLEALGSAGAAPSATGGSGGFWNGVDFTGTAPMAGSGNLAPTATQGLGNTLGNAASSVGNAILKNPIGALGTAAMVSQLAGGGGGDAVPSLDPTSAAAAQANANKESSLFDAYLNRPDQVTPYGSSKWTLKPGADPKNPQPGDWVQTQALTDTGQQLLESDQALQLGLSGAGQSALGRVTDTLGAPLDVSGAPALGQVSNFTGDSRQRIEDALMARLAPGFAQDEEAMRSRLLNTGFEFGSEGAQREQTRFDKAKNDARLAAIVQSGQEAERLGNISRADANFQNQSRQQAIQEILAQRALPLNELNAIRTGTQVQQPQFSSVTPTNTASAPVMEALLAQLQGQQTNAANKQSGYNALLQSLAGLGSAWINSGD